MVNKGKKRAAPVVTGENGAAGGIVSKAAPTVRKGRAREGYGVTDQGPAPDGYASGPARFR